jgi:alpha-glucoside transport system substrate-binding protein
MRKIVTLLLIGLLVVGVGVFAADKKVVDVMHGWPGEQAPVFQMIVDAFEAQNPDIDVQVEIVGRDRPAILATRLAGGNPPDLTPHPWIGLMKEWANAGQIVDLKGLVDTSDINPALVPIGEYDDGLYGLFIFPNVKSLVWYNPKVFAANGYEIPTTWYELLALNEQILADGGVPLSIGLESGAASGWPGTDWIEDIMLRTAGADVYDKWVSHEISWTDPRVKKAFEIFGNLFDDGYVLGGKIGALTTNFGDAPDALFTAPPTAYMHKQATFIAGFINDHFDGLVAGEDYNVFVLPTITPQATPDGSVPLLVSGDVVTVFNNRPEVIKFAQFLTSETAANIWSSELGELSAYVGASADDFDNPITRKAQEMLLSASVSRFDGSDLMPGAIGAGAFWSGVLDYISGVSLDTVLETIEAAAKYTY